MDSDKVRKLSERATHLTALSNSPSYPILRDIINEKIRLETRRFISKVAVSPQELDYGRGMLRGMQVVLDVIEGGEKELERAIQQARAIEELEGA